MAILFLTMRSWDSNLFCRSTYLKASNAVRCGYANGRAFAVLANPGWNAATVAIYPAPVQGPSAAALRDHG